MPAPTDPTALAEGVRAGDRRSLARAITLVESTRADHREQADALVSGLLPDNPDVLMRWAAQFGVSSTEPFALLGSPIGEDRRSGWHRAMTAHGLPAAGLEAAVDDTVAAGDTAYPEEIARDVALLAGWLGDERLVQVGGAVVHAGEEVVVEVDHRPPSWPWEARNHSTKRGIPSLILVAGA